MSYPRTLVALASVAKASRANKLAPNSTKRPTQTDQSSSIILHADTTPENIKKWISELMIPLMFEWFKNAAHLKPFVMYQQLYVTFSF